MALLLVAACGGDAILPNDSDASLAATASVLSCGTGSSPQFEKKWDCFQLVDLWAPDGALRLALGPAADEWRNAANISGLPQFYSSTDSSTANALVIGAASGTPACGAWFKELAPPRVIIYSAGGCDNFDNSGSRTDVLRHELAHAFGWTGNGAHTLRVTGVSDHCMIALPSSGAFNAKVCAQEIEGAAAAYGLRTLPTDYWSKEFVVGSVNSLSATSVAVGNTVTLNPGAWRLDRGGSTAGTYSWTSSNTTAATVVGGVVTGVATGTTTITAQPVTSGSSYLFTTPFTNNGVSSTVTVTGSSPVNLSVMSITGSGGIDTLPIHEPGSYLLTAHLGAGDDTGVTFKWTVIFSNALGDSVVSHSDTLPPWGPPTRTVVVPSPIGSYTITARVRAGRDSTEVGGVTSHDFVVCPRPPGNDLKEKSDNGGNGTDAVGGC